MKRELVVALVWVSVTAAVIGFFLPWVRIELRDPTAPVAKIEERITETVPLGQTVGGVMRGIGRITGTIRKGAETIAGDLPIKPDSIPREISGAQIPQLAHREDVKLVFGLIELAKRRPQQAALKSQAVYLVPGLAFVLGLLLTLLGGIPAVAAGAAAVSAGVAGVAAWKLLTFSTQTALAVVTIGHGLWMSVLAYAGLAVSASLFLVAPRSH